MQKFSDLQLLAKVNDLAREIARDYLEVVGGALVDYLQKKLGEKDVDMYGASVEGQYPSRDTSSLQESIDFKTYARGGRVFMKFGSMDDVRLFGKDTNPTLYARILEYSMSRKLTHAAWEEAKQKGIVARALSKAKHERRGGAGEFIRVPGPAKREVGGRVKRDSAGRVDVTNVPLSD